MRESSFLLCQRSVSDDRFARYPQLPVRECPGYEPFDERRSHDESEGCFFTSSEVHRGLQRRSR